MRPLLIRAQTNTNAQEAGSPRSSPGYVHTNTEPCERRAHMHTTAADCGFRCCDFPPAFPLALTDSPLCSDPAPDWERWGGGGHLTELICSRNSTDALVNTLSRTHTCTRVHVRASTSLSTHTCIYTFPLLPFCLWEFYSFSNISTCV